jgi:hypothetical protein
MCQTSLLLLKTMTLEAEIFFGYFLILVLQEHYRFEVCHDYRLLLSLWLHSDPL